MKPETKEVVVSAQCRTCGKRVTAKRGKLSCCGITEDVREAIAENRRHSRAVSEKLSRVLFDPVMASPNDNWDGDPNEDMDYYEGIPNT